ncbi:MAG: trigger factor [Candidatus Saccharimonadales bacterium]
METKIITRTDEEVTFTITVSEAELAKIKTEVFNHLRGNVKAAGFRPGKAPDMIVERELGPNAVQSEVIDHALQHSYPDAVKELKLQIVSSPKISIDKFVPYTQLEYSVTAELLPKVKLADYTKMRVKRPAIKVEAAEINRTIEDLRRRESARLDSELPAKLGDEVNFDFAGTKDGQEVPGASAKNQTLQLGSGQFIPGFEEEIIGLKKGDEKTFDIKFPDTYHEQTLAGETVTFSVKINTVTDLVLPEVNEEFIGRVSPFKTVKELEADITNKLTAEKAETSAREYEQEVLSKLLKESEFKTPAALIDQQLERMRGELEQNLAYSGLNFDKYLELSGKSKADMDKEMRPEAERRVGLAMILTEVATAEKLSVTPEELDKEITRLKAEYKDPATQAELDNPNTREEIYNHLMSSKVIAKLVSFADAK